jgi:serine protease Do
MSHAIRTCVVAAILAVSATARAQSSVETIAAVAPKVVKIFGAGGGQKLHAYGSGFLVSPNGHIVTVWSHILDGDTVTIVLDDGRRFDGRVLGAEPPLDMAVLKIEAEGLPYFDLAQAAEAGPGTRVLAFSNAFKVATGDEPVTVMHGVISAKTTLAARRGAFESPYTGPVYVVDAVTNNSGAAGGVLTTWDGRLLGMIGKELRNSQTNTWLNYVMPIGELKETIGQIVTGDFSSKKRPNDDEESPGKPRPRRYEPLDFGIVTIPDVLNRTPAYIDRVLPGSQAEKVGLLPNDLILFVGENLVQSCKVLKDDLGRLEANDPLKMVVRRGDKLVSVEMVAPRKEME